MYPVHVVSLGVFQYKYLFSFFGWFSFKKTSHKSANYQIKAIAKIDENIILYTTIQKKLIIFLNEFFTHFCITLIWVKLKNV